MEPNVSPTQLGPSNFGAECYRFARERNKKTMASSCSCRIPDRPVENAKATQDRRASCKPTGLSNCRRDRNRLGGSPKTQNNQRQRRSKWTCWRVTYETWVSLRKFSLSLLGTRIPFLFHRPCSSVHNVSRHTKRPTLTAKRRLPLLLDGSDVTDFSTAPSV